MLAERLKSIIFITIVFLLFSSLSSNAQAISYSYDNINRLTNVTYDDGSKIDYSYDAVGNLLTTVYFAASFDTDNDGIPDSTDNCPSVSNPGQTNTDSDSLGNACDIDDDNDGMPDTWELLFGLNPLDSNDASLDGDNDGLTNLAEYNANRNPTINEAAIIIQPILMLLKQSSD